MRKTTRWFNVSALMLCILLVFTVCVTGCSSSSTSSDTSDTVTTASSKTESYERDPNLNAPGEIPICKEKVTIKVGTPQHQFVKDFETNFMTQQLEADGNFNLEFVLYPSEDYRKKIDLMVAAGGSDLPDVLMNNPNDPFTDAQVYNYGIQGAIIPLTKYYKNSCYYIDDVFKRAVKDDDLYKYITAPNGEMYYIPIYNQSLLNECRNKIFLYQPWLDKLGLDIPKTPEEYKNVLRAIKNGDPNGNGLADEIPLTGSSKYLFAADGGGLIDTLMTPFVYASGMDYWNVDNGVLSVAFTKNEWKEGLTYIRSLVQEGLLSVLSFTQDQDQYEAILNAATTVVGSFVYDSPQHIGPTDKRRAEYTAVPPLASADGSVVTVYKPSMPTVGMVVTSNCKNPEAAFRLGDLLCSRKYGIATRYGWEELGDWVKPKEGDKSLYAHLGYKPLLVSKLNWGSTHNSHWNQVGPFMRTYDIAAGVCVADNPLNTSYIIAQSLGQYRAAIPKFEIVSKLVYSEEEQEELNEIQTVIQNYLKESVARFCTGDMSIENDWDDYLAELDSMGIDRLIEIGQAAYDRMNKKK